MNTIKHTIPDFTKPKEPEYLKDFGKIKSDEEVKRKLESIRKVKEHLDNKIFKDDLPEIKVPDEITVEQMDEIFKNN